MYRLSVKKNLTQARVINQEHGAKFATRGEKIKGCSAHQHFRFSETRRSRFSGAATTPEYMGNQHTRVFLRPKGFNQIIARD
jgi:hypothetical protein